MNSRKDNECWDGELEVDDVDEDKVEEDADDEDTIELIGGFEIG